MDQKQRLIERLDQAHAGMRAVVARMKPDQVIYPDWTIKQLLAHLAGWDDATIASLRAHTAGEIPAMPAALGIDYYNAQTVEERQSLDLQHIYAEWEKTRLILKEVVAAIPEDRMDKTFVYPWGGSGDVAGLLTIMADHEEEHAADMAKLIPQ